MIEKKDPKLLGRVAVLLGGTTKEREVSLESGEAVYQSLLHMGVDVHCIDVNSQGTWWRKITEGQFDGAFIILHGGYGEDGTVQGMLEILGIPYTGSGVLGSAITMDKLSTKAHLQANQLAYLPYMALTSLDQKAACIEKLGLPLCIKPVSQGSSLGVTKVKKVEDFDEAFSQAERYGSVMAEPWVEKARELFVPVVLNKAYTPVEVRTTREFYDYTAKYIDHSTEYLCPAPISNALIKQAQALALASFDSCHCSGWGRVDFMLDQDESLWIQEINTVPGMTQYSLVPLSVKDAGYDFDTLVYSIMYEALAQKDKLVQGVTA